MKQEDLDTIFETLRLVNDAVVKDKNALTSTSSGEVNPGKAYIQLIQSILKLHDTD
jgi:hypothetical protein